MKSLGLVKEVRKSFVRLAGDLANVALKTVVVVYTATQVLEYIGILVKS